MQRLHLYCFFIILFIFYSCCAIFPLYLAAAFIGTYKCINMLMSIHCTNTQPNFFINYIKFRNWQTNRQNSKLSRKLIYKHENSMQFPCLYYITHFSTAFSVKLIPFSAKTNNILLLFTFPFYTITETPDFCVKVYFCLIVRFFPLSPSYQRHPKTKKLESTTHRGEPHQA